MGWAKGVLLAAGVVIVAAFGAQGKVIYIDDDANSPGDGASWATAYKYLQDGLADARAAAGGRWAVEVRVAQGVYRPDRSAAEPNGTGDRLASFELASGVALLGGYAGLGAADSNARETSLYETILSGDLAGDDVLAEDPCDFVPVPGHGVWERPDVWNILIESTRLENSVHVLVAAGTNETAVLDGFTITGGNAYHPPYWFGHDAAITFDDYDRGGGILNIGGGVTLRACTFIANSAMGSGGALYNNGPGRLVMEDCCFVEDFSWMGGGAVENRSTDVVMTGCLFERNDAWLGEGAAMYSWDSDLLLEDCTFMYSGAVGRSLGAVYSVGGRGVYARCKFEANTRRLALYNSQAEVMLKGCTFAGNAGGGVYTTAKTRLENCMFLFNEGGALGIRRTGDVSVTNSLFFGNVAQQRGAAVSCLLNAGITIRNSVFWNNEAPIGPDLALWQSPDGSNPSSADVYYSLMENGQAGVAMDSNCVLFWGEGNIDDDPCFADLGYWDPNGTAADVNDDFFIEGDYHVKSQGGRWDSAAGQWVIDEVTSPCIDAGDPGSPIGLEPFANGGRVNMGVYGGTVEASKSYFGGPVCETIVAGDINGDCRVDFVDLSIFVRHWLEGGNTAR